MHLIAVVLDNTHTICRLHPDGGGVATGVDTDNAVGKIDIQKERRLPLSIIKKTKGRHGTRLEPHN